MGCCCFGRTATSLSDSEDVDDGAGTNTNGKSRPLIRHRIRWRSEIPLTEKQLRRKRDEYWETAPAFDGRKEIWDALKAAAAHAEHCDYQLAQAILDGACITLPDGTLRESYDELGSRYTLPLYCLSKPQNLLADSSSSSSRRSSQSGVSTDQNAIEKRPSGPMQTIKLRLSTTGQDIKMDVHPTETIKAVKRLLHAQLEGVVPSASNQRWFFGGRLLLDKLTIDDCSIPPHFVVQVVLKESTKPPEAEVHPLGNQPPEQEEHPSRNGTPKANERRSSMESIRTTKSKKKRRSHSEPVQR